MSANEASLHAPVPQRGQGMLFGDPLPELDINAGYRGPIACRAAGITYRQLDYWARTGLVEPSGAPRVPDPSACTLFVTFCCSRS